MRAALFVPRYNAANRHDTDEFKAEARRFCAAHGLSTRWTEFDNHLRFERRRNTVLAALGMEEGLDAVVFFCHGWKDGIQAGFRTKQLEGFADAIRAASGPVVTVVMYCCSTGADADKATPERLPGAGGEGGFADLLRDALARAGVAATVYGHSVPGHTTKNPWMRVFTPGVQMGGTWVVGAKSRLWLPWKRVLADPENTFRFRFPFMDPEAVAAELEIARSRMSRLKRY